MTTCRRTFTSGTDLKAYYSNTRFGSAGRLLTGANSKSGAGMGGSSPKRVDGGLATRQLRKAAAKNRSVGVNMKDVIDVRYMGGHRVWVCFNDGVAGELDLKPRLQFTGVFEPLVDPAYFAKVRVDPEAGTIVWPNEADPLTWTSQTGSLNLEEGFIGGVVAPLQVDLRSRYHRGHKVARLCGPRDRRPRGAGRWSFRGGSARCTGGGNRRRSGWSGA